MHGGVRVAGAWLNVHHTVHPGHRRFVVLEARYSHFPTLLTLAESEGLNHHSIFCGFHLIITVSIQHAICPKLTNLHTGSDCGVPIPAHAWVLGFTCSGAKAARSRARRHSPGNSTTPMELHPCDLSYRSVRWAVVMSFESNEAMRQLVCVHHFFCHLVLSPSWLDNESRRLL